MDDVHIPTTKAVEQRLADFQALTGVKKVTGIMQREQKWDDMSLMIIMLQRLMPLLNVLTMS